MSIKKNNPVQESLKKFHFQDFVYASVIVVFLLITVVIFFFAAQFISKNINKIFSIGDESSVQALNIDQYTLIAKKLNIKINTTQEATPTVETSMITTEELDKRALTITVKNSTTKKGVASALATALEDAGFQKPKTGNEPKLYATTKVILKESKSLYSPLILDIVQKYYPSASVATTSETSISDVTVIIGTN